MNNRLVAIKSLVCDGVGLIDVGTDHGYLPIALAKDGYSGNLLASDIHEGPLQAAKRNTEENGLSGRIQFQLCDGLSQCDPEQIDTIAIAGMGGDLICRILDQAEWTMDGRYTMILQPMSKPEVLRYWLSNNEYGIVQELLTEDGDKLYSILKVQFGAPCKLLKDAELFLGQYELIQNDPLFSRARSLQMARMNKLLQGIQAGGAQRDDGKRALYMNILDQLREME